MIRILIVDDQNIIRQGLQAILTTESDLEIIGVAENGLQAIEYLETNQPDIALIDVEMPEMDGLTLTQIIRQRFPQIQVIILSSYDDRDNINKAIQSGAKGYLLKQTPGQEIIDTIRYVQRGYFQLGPGLFENLLSHLIDREQAALEQIEVLEKKYTHYLEHLEQEVERKAETVRKQLTQEFESQINNLQFKFKEGLEIFQQQVTNKTKDDVVDLINQLNNLKNDHLNQNIEQQTLVNHQYIAIKSSIKKLEKQTGILRYGLIIIFICYFIDKLITLSFNRGL
jgi:YesN/AraC family two-component response regulator